MNSKIRSGRRKVQSLRDRLAEWRELVERCGQKPTRKRVHALRVVTLRIQAEVDGELSHLPDASHQAQAMLRFGKLSDKLRDALGSVRELDVWIGKLQGLSQSLSGTAEYVPRSTRNMTRQIRRLEERLTRKRRTAGEKLVAQIGKWRTDFMEGATALDHAAGDPGHEIDGQEVGKILKEFAGVLADFARFDEDNLHAFRKRIKTLRYTAEIHCTDRECGRIVARLKKVQTVIGEWHDWQVLARTVGRGKHANDAELGEILDNIAKEAFDAAIEECQGIRAQSFILDAKRVSETVRHLPVRSERLHSLDVKKLA